MRNGEGGTVPSYNLQLLTDVQHGLVVNVEATTDAIDYRQLEPAIARCEQRLGCKPKQLVADGDYTNDASVQAAAAHGVDFYGSWQDSWKPGERDAQGRDRAFQASAFPYDSERDCFTCPAGKIPNARALMNRGNGVRTRVYRAPKAACPNCPLPDQCAPTKARQKWVRSITRLIEPAATTAFKNKPNHRVCIVQICSAGQIRRTKQPPISRLHNQPLFDDAESPHNTRFASTLGAPAFT
jgi:hypothetical protein